MLNIEQYSGIQMIANPHTTSGFTPSFLSKRETEPVRHLHMSLDDYAATPLVELSALARRSGVRSILVKDESQRFGLNAFKALGGLFALVRVICKHLGLDYRVITMDWLQEPEIQRVVSNMVFVSATDGNHGRGISWAAGMLGCEAHIYMPKGSVPARAQAIRDAGRAEGTITDMSYDDAVRHAAKMAEENGWFLIQDTSWPGYEEVPKWIIQGYTTMVYEAVRQMQKMGYSRPTHVFLQAGVGAMAGGGLGSLKCIYQDALPCVSIVEPDQVACIFESALQNDGLPHPASGSGETIMAGLNCGEPCQITWPILRDHADFYFACPDSVAARGMRVLAAPMPGDQPITSGESGAVTAGLLSLLTSKESLAPFREKLGLAPGPSLFHWKETLPYLGFAGLFCLAAPVIVWACDDHRIPLLSILYAVVILPLAGFTSGLSLGRRHGFCPLYPVACGAVAGVFVAAAWLCSYSLGGSRILAAAFSALAGNLAGAALLRRKRQKADLCGREGS